MVRTESVEKARERMEARLKEHGFHPCEPGDYAPREDAFALERHVDDDHSIHVEVLFGKAGADGFFRLNVGVGPAGVAYDELPFLGDEKGEGIRMPFFRVLMCGKFARLQQRFYNLFVGPPSWNHTASDTFYCESDEDIPAQIDSAASLIARAIPPFIEHLKRTGYAAPRLESPYRPVPR